MEAYLLASFPAAGGICPLRIWETQHRIQNRLLQRLKNPGAGEIQSRQYQTRSISVAITCFCFFSRFSLAHVIKYTHSSAWHPRPAWDKSKSTRMISPWLMIFHPYSSFDTPSPVHRGSQLISPISFSTEPSPQHLLPAPAQAHVDCSTCTIHLGP